MALWDGLVVGKTAHKDNVYDKHFLHFDLIPALKSTVFLRTCLVCFMATEVKATFSSFKSCSEHGIADQSINSL